MRNIGQCRVLGLLGVGFDHADGQIRITEGEDYEVVMGSDESHQALQQICQQVAEHIQKAGRVLSDYTAEEFMKLMQEIY